MAASAVIGRCDVFDSSGMGAELEALAETPAGGIVRVIDCDGLAAIAVEHGEARDIGRAIANVNHVFEGDGAEFRGHVIVDVLIVAEHALVDAEEELRFGRVGDGALGEADAAVAIFAEFATEDGLYVGVEA